MQPHATSTILILTTTTYNRSDNQYYFDFDDSVKSVALDIGAATNPLLFDQTQDTGQLVFAFEGNPAWLGPNWDATEKAAVSCRVDAFCALLRRYWWFAALSEEVKNVTFNVAPNPYCSSVEVKYAITA